MIFLELTDIKVLKCLSVVISLSVLHLPNYLCVFPNKFRGQKYGNISQN